MSVTTLDKVWYSSLMSNERPLTHSTAAKVAETVTLAEFKELLASTRAVTILAPNRSRRHAYDRPSLREVGRSVWVSFEAADRGGYCKFYIADVVGRKAAIFDFYQLGRLVKVVG